MKKRTAVWIFTPPLLVLLAGMLAWGWLIFYAYRYDKVVAGVRELDDSLLHVGLYGCI